MYILVHDYAQVWKSDVYIVLLATILMLGVGYGRYVLQSSMQV